MDLRTDYQKRRDARHTEICGEFRRLEKQNPHASLTRICTAVAEKFGMTQQGVRNIVKNHALA